MEIIDIECPRSINLLTVNNDKNTDVKGIFQTINIYDNIILNQNIKNKDNVIIKSSSNISKGMHEKMNELLLLYANYINMKINNISVNVKYNEISCLKKEENILAGFLLALNYYFKNQITPYELIYLANKIDNLISYYIVGDYKEITCDNKNISIGKNKYNKYYLLEHSNDINTLEKIKEIFNKNKIIYGKDECFFVPTKDFISTNLLITLKREIPDIMIRTVNNTKDHKVLVKYTNYE